MVLTDTHPWLTYLLALLLCSTIHKLFFFPATKTKTKSQNLPPGPPFILTIFGIIKFVLIKDLVNMKPVLRYLRGKYGPILTLSVTSKPIILISDHTLAHLALVRHGAAMADREPTSEASVAFAPYGPTWRLLRRNLISELILPSRQKQFTGARNWALRVLLDDLKTQAAAMTGSGDGAVIVAESFQLSMCCLMLFICLGEKLDFTRIREIKEVHDGIYTQFYIKSKIFQMFPTFTKIVFRKEWKMLLDLMQRQEEIFFPLIRERAAAIRGGGGVRCYVDSLIELSIAEEGGRRLTEGEVLSICSELLLGGINSISTVLEWVMAELVKHQEIQERLRDEIQEVVPVDEEIKEEDLAKMSYLRAVILEGLRRHPTGYTAAPHVASEDVEIGGYVVPKGASVNFLMADMGWDEEVWDEPMKFRPERFLGGGEGEGVDITGNREIKMMPFGVGRRMCAGMGMSMLHLQYFVANLVREFEWRVVDGEEVDLSEKVELTVVMKNRLRSKIVPLRENVEKFFEKNMCNT